MLHVVKTDIKPKPNYVLTRGYCSCMYFAFLFQMQNYPNETGEW